MPAVCDALGLQFEYPDNWEIDLFEGPSGGGAIVSSPETAFWQVTRHPPDAEFELMFDEALAALRSEYKDIEAHAASETVDGRQLEGYDVNFYCLDLTNTCQLRALRSDEAAFLVVAQAEDRELETVAVVFAAILTSLVRSQAAARLTG